MGYIGLGLAHTVGAINSIARSEVFLKLLLALKIRLYGPRMRESYVEWRVDMAGGTYGDEKPFTHRTDRTPELTNLYMI